MATHSIMLAGRVALVTGAAGEIGRVIAADLLKAGGTVVLAGPRVKSLQTQIHSLPQSRERSMIARLDVRREADVRRLVARMISRFGRIDILVNNAAVRGPTAPAVKLSRRDWDKVIDTNLTGPFLCARECLKHMIAQGNGCILNISSVAGRMAYPLRAAYASSKWGIIGLTLTLAQEAGASNVRVNAICPGPVEGPAMKEVISRRARATKTPLAEMTKRFVRPAALGRMVTTRDVSQLVLFLSSDDARNITGQVIEVSAGFGLWPGS